MWLGAAALLIDLVTGYGPTYPGFFLALADYHYHLRDEIVTSNGEWCGPSA